jgi:hypothetical protein
MDHELSQVLGFITTQPEFLALDGPEAAQQAKKTDEGGNIEIDLENMSLAKVQFLQNFLQTPQLQEKYHQLMIQEHQQKMQQQQ